MGEQDAVRPIQLQGLFFLSGVDGTQQAAPAIRQETRARLSEINLEGGAGLQVRLTVTQGDDCFGVIQQGVGVCLLGLHRRRIGGRVHRQVQFSGSLSEKPRFFPADHCIGVREPVRL